MFKRVKKALQKYLSLQYADLLQVPYKIYHSSKGRNVSFIHMIYQKKESDKLCLATSLSKTKTNIQRRMVLS